MYEFIENEFKPHEKEIGELPIGMLLVDFLKSLPLVNPKIFLNGKELFNENGEILLKIEDDYRIKSDDSIYIVNQVKGGIVESATSYLVGFIFASYVLSALTPKISTPTASTSETTEGTSEYAISSNQNTASKGQPIPECFGTYVRNPDIVAPVYYRYENNKEYMYMLLCLGVGQHTINNIYIDDTNISELTSGTFSYRLLKTEAEHTGADKIKNDWNATFSDSYFRDIVITADELENFTLTTETDSEMSLFQLNGDSDLVDLIEFDINFYSGLYSQNSDGTLGDRSIDIRFTIVDDLNNTTTYTETIIDNTRNQIQQTFSYPVTSGVYQVKAERVTLDATDTTIQDEVHCVRIKGYVVSDTDYIEYGDVTLMPVKIKATEGISGKGQFQVKVNATRDGLETLTDAIEYVWSNDNGGRQSLSRLSLPSEMDNYSYNHYIDSRTTVLKTLQSMASNSRFNLYSSFGIMTARLDEEQPIKKMMFNETNIVRDSLKITMSAIDDSDYDGVKVGYKDAETFEELYYTYPTDASFPEDVSLDGVTDEAIAISQAEFIYKDSIYRNKKYQFDTELDGLVPSLYDRCSITHPILKTSQSGFINGFTSTQVELNEAIREDYSDPYIFFRDRDGKPSSLYHITNIDGRVITIDVSGESLPNDLYVNSDEQRTIYSLGDLGFIDDIIITEIKPKSDTKISITAWNYDDRLYS